MTPSQYAQILMKWGELHTALCCTDCPDEPIRKLGEAFRECEHQILNPGSLLDEIEPAGVGK